MGEVNGKNCPLKFTKLIWKQIVSIQKYSHSEKNWVILKSRSIQSKHYEISLVDLKKGDWNNFKTDKPTF